MAQLVEHNLAKVGVAGSNPVVRSRKSPGGRGWAESWKSARWLACLLRAYKIGAPAVAEPGAYRNRLDVDRAAPTRLAAMKTSRSPFVNLTQRPTLMAASWRLAHSSRTCLGVVHR